VEERITYTRSAAVSFSDSRILVSDRHCGIEITVNRICVFATKSPADSYRAVSGSHLSTAADQLPTAQYRLQSVRCHWCRRLLGSIANRQTNVNTSINDVVTFHRPLSIVSSSSLSLAITNAKSVANKLPEFRLFWQNNDLNLLCVTKTWLNGNTPNSLICPQGYNIYRYDRPTRAGVYFVRDTVVLQ